MILTKTEAMAAFQKADDAWHAELVRRYGKSNARDARYDAARNGTHEISTPLGRTARAFTEAAAAFRLACKAHDEQAREVSRMRAQP